jgi:hypothetical protein
VLTRMRVVLLALMAIAVVAAPSAGANAPPSRSFELPELEIFDLHLTTACGGDWVFANVTGTVDERLVLNKDGSVNHEIESFHGRITWFKRNSDKSYSASLVNRVRIDYPEGVDLFKPAVITVTGHHGGTFPIGGGPPGGGTLVYNGFVYAVDDEGFTYWATEGAPISMSGNFDGWTRRICEALS